MSARFYAVPAGTHASTCRGPSCGKRMWWVVTRDGRRVPVDCNVEGGQPPSETALKDQADLFAPGGMAHVFDGRGVSHFETCVDAELFSRGMR